MKKWLLIFFVFLSFSTQAQEPWTLKTIKVGGYLWEPFVELHGRSYEGMTLDLIDAANKTQGDFKFEFVLTTPENRFKDFHSGKFDMMFFEDIDWGWNAYPMQASQPLAKGTELYIALYKSGRDQRFFQDLKSKSMSALKGMHYSFTGHNTNETYLKEHFKITLEEQPSQVLKDVLDEEAEIGVLNSLYLQYAFSKDNRVKNKLFIGQKFDQDFVLSILVRKNAEITVEQVNLLLERLKNEGVLKALWDKYQIDPKVPVNPPQPAPAAS